MKRLEELELMKASIQRAKEENAKARHKAYMESEIVKRLHGAVAETEVTLRLLPPIREGEAV